MPEPDSSKGGAMGSLGRIHIERRGNRRFSITLPVNLSISGRADKPFINGHVMEMSKGGIRIVTNTAFHTGDLLDMDILLPQEDTRISGLAEVVWVRLATNPKIHRTLTYVMGISFVQVEGCNRTRLARVIEENLKELSVY